MSQLMIKRYSRKNVEPTDWFIDTQERLVSPLVGSEIFKEGWATSPLVKRFFRKTSAQWLRDNQHRKRSDLFLAHNLGGPSL